VPDSLTPHSVPELQAFMAEIRPRLALTPEAKAAARSVLSVRVPVPRRYVVPARVAWTTVSLVAIGLLPDSARRMYRLPPLPGAGVAARATMRSLRVGVDKLPPHWSHGPIYHAAMARAATSADCIADYA
jgi:uncharacterized protein (DUF2236 family)